MRRSFVTAVGEKSSLEMPPDGEFRSVDPSSPNKMFEVAISPSAIHIRSGFSKAERMIRGEALFFNRFLDVSPHIAKYFGYVLCANRAGYLLRGPNIAELNAKKSLLADAAGVNNAWFVESNADSAPNPEYIGYTTRGEMPLSQQPTGAVHDLLTHVPGQALANQHLFESQVEAAEWANSGGSEWSINQIAQLIDGVSAWLVMKGGYINVRDLQGLYTAYAPGLLSDAQAARDALAQTAVMDEINQVLQHRPPS